LLQADDNLAVDAAAVLLGPFLKPLVQLVWDVLNGQCGHRGLLYMMRNGTIMEVYLGCPI
jgi:hypothetical protein